MILLLALAEYAVSGFFGVITYLGAFAEDVFSVRSTFNDLIGRAVWLAFLTIAAMAVYRVYRAMYPPVVRTPYAYGPTMYGRPYPGQPTYPRPGNYAPTYGAAQPTDAYPPPTDAAADATVRIADPAAEATRLIPPVPAQSPEADTASLPTQPTPPRDASSPARPTPPGDASIPGGTPER
jgi:hypothetical protein